MDPNHEPCSESGCIYYNPKISAYCGISDHICVYGAEGFKTAGDIKRAMLAWGIRGLIYTAGQGSNFILSINVRNKDMDRLARTLSSHLPVGMKLKIRTLPVWRCWFRKVAIV